MTRGVAPPGPTPANPLITDQGFANYTIRERLPKVITTTASHQQDEDAKKRLLELKDSLAQGKPVTAPSIAAEGGEEWQQAFTELRASVPSPTWHNIPWYFAEALMYRLILEMTGFFSGERKDPFLAQKMEELKSPGAWSLVESALSVGALGHKTEIKEGTEEAALQGLLQYAVWGNRVDLCYTEVATEGKRGVALSSEQSNLLIDDSSELIRWWKQRKPLKSVQYVCDNSGNELLMDLVLIDWLLTNGWASTITLHCKRHPTFVSDATEEDVAIHLRMMQQQGSKQVTELAARLQRYEKEGRLQVTSHLFWNSHRFFTEFPDELKKVFEGADLTIMKGDANYRRILRDTPWPPTTPFSAPEAAGHWPGSGSLLCLRTLKSDPIVGLTQDAVEALDKADPNWRVNGKRGVIQALIRP